MLKINPRLGKNCISFIRVGKFFVFSLICILFISNFVSAQESIGINYFDLANSDAGSQTCWDSYAKGYAWIGGGPTFVNCSRGTNGGPVPVNMSIGNGSLVFTTTRPNGSGWCNIQIKMDWGKSINYLRYGDDPLLHLRIKWGAIATGADYKILLYDDHQIWNKHAIYNQETKTYSSHSAGVYLSDYVVPSTSAWQDVYIPMSQFTASNPDIDLTKIVFIEFSAIGNYSTANTIYLEKIRIIRDESNQYNDMIKVNQLGYLPNLRKLAIVSYLTGAVSSAPTYFQLKNSDTGAVAYQGNLSLDTPTTLLAGHAGST
jgi:hypothetical protein